MQAFLKNIPSWAYAVSVFVLWITILIPIKKILIRVFLKFVQKTETKWDDIILRAVSFPLTVIIIVTGVLIGIRFFNLAPAWQSYINTIIKIITIIAIIYFLEKLFLAILKEYRDKSDFARSSSNIIQTIIHIFVLGIGILIILDSLGISITPLIASLGIGSVAIALALQDTLSNIFSGIYMILDKPIQVGHYISLDSGQQGYVEKVGWRSTRIRMLPNNTLIIPNSKLSSSIITNYYLPQKEMSVLIQVGVHYDSDLEKVEKITIEVAKKILKEVSGGVESFEPFIRYHTFDSSSINFTVILRCKEYVDNYLLKHEFIKNLQARYKKEGIVIPFPIRTIYMHMQK